MTSKINQKKDKKNATTSSYGSAVYFQRTKVFQEEFKLIGVVAEREDLITQLETIIREVKEGRKDCEDETILQTFRLFNQVRFSTIKVIKAISIWQESFTRNLRPIIFQSDYIIEKLIKHINFINSSQLRKIFNFQFYRGNMLLLPFSNLKNQDLPIKVSSLLGKEIREFANPNENDIIAAYNILYNCLPEEIFKEKLISLEKWLLDPWIPRIWVANITMANVDQKLFLPSGKPKTAKDYQDEMNIEKRKAKALRNIASKANNSNPMLKSRPNSPLASSGLLITIPKINSNENSRPTSPSALQLLSKGSSPRNITPTSSNRRQTSFRALASTSDEPEKNDITPVGKLRRRNQLAPTQAAQLLSFTNLEVLDEAAILEMEMKKAKEQEQQEDDHKEELQALDDYFGSLEKQFLFTTSSIPKLPQINFAAAKPGNPFEDQLSPDPFTKTSKVFFLHHRSDESLADNDDDEDEIQSRQLSLTDTKDGSKSNLESNDSKAEGETGSKSEDQKKETKENAGEENTEAGDESVEEKASSKLPELSQSAPEEVPNELKSPKKVIRAKSKDFRRISDLTVTFSVQGEGEKKDASTPLSGSRRSSSSAKGSGSLSKRKKSNSTNSSGENSASTTVSSTNALKRTLSKIKLSTSFVREWYRSEGK